MTSNDEQIDVLLRRYAGQSPGKPVTEHLDADELNAFAEGSLPEAARTRYFSHLLDCDNCRQIVSQLAISSSAVVAAEAAPAPGASGYSWWKRLSGFLSPMTLRYAAFAMVLITVAGVVLLVTQRPRESNQLAKIEQTKQSPEGVVKPPDAAVPQTVNSNQSGGNENKQGLMANPASSAQPSPNSDEVAKLDQPKAGDNPALPPAPAKAAKEADPTSNPALAANKKAESNTYQNAPAYSPPPPVERQRAESESREQPSVGGVATASGPRKSEPPVDKSKAMDRGRGGEAGKDIRADDNSRVAANQAPASKRINDEKVKGPRRDVDNTSRNSSVVTEDAVKSQRIVVAKPAAAEEKPSETRSAGGHKFKRQGSGWVDTKFKSSMTLKSISRGSSEFDAIDSGVRSIAQQLGGQVIVVWKGKAYLIK
jgi:hypothetical protein